MKVKLEDVLEAMDFVKDRLEKTQDNNDNTNILSL